MVDDAMEMAPGRTYVRFICLPAYLVLPELFNLFDNILVKYQSVTYVSHLMHVYDFLIINALSDDRQFLRYCDFVVLIYYFKISFIKYPENVTEVLTRS